MYAIVDIETTGGQPNKSSITEIAIIIFDGKKIINKFCSLVNPQCYIPYFITNLTGITNEMVENAPKFHEIAKQIVEITKDCVFVAHNVNFDYGFVKAAFKNLGYNYHRKTLCTVKLSRKTFPKLSSYSLGNLCKTFNINNLAQHRAFGDAEATTKLFEKIIQTYPGLFSEENLKEEIKKEIIPVELDENILKTIPENITGVYYFHNSSGEIIYVGKSVDIKKRIIQHFSVSAHTNRRSMMLKNDIADITFENTGSELVALLLESDEIKKLKPSLNLAQKKVKQVPFYGIYSDLDNLGYLTFVIEHLSDQKEAIFTADNLSEAKEFLYKMIEKHHLCLSKCGLHKTGGPCFNHQIEKCMGACCSKETVKNYNLKAEKAIEENSFQNKSFFIVDIGRNMYEKSIICIENGQYRGFGFIDTDYQMSIEELRDCIKKYSHNRDIQLIIKRFENKNLHKIPFQTI